MKKISLSSLSLIAIAALVVSCHAGGDTAALQTEIDSLKSVLQPLAAKDSTEEANKKMVAEFYQKLFGDKNVAAIDEYLLPTYIQHNPMLPDGSAALKEGATRWFTGAPKDTIDVHHLSADGDLVYIHTKTMMGGKPWSVIDIFRIQNGKIAEHWDVLEEVPARSANGHPMF